jgi:hypothetical protein
LGLGIMIQYDRIVGEFVLKDGVQFLPGLEVCSKLNEELASVRSWLNLKRRNGRYAHGFLAELAANSMNRTLHVFAIYDEIGKLEGTDPSPSVTKKPRKMRPPLGGLWHKHYFQPSFMPRNLIDETEQMDKDGRWEAMFAPHYGKYVHEFIDQITHEMVIGAYERRARDRRITGEFIVYERLPDGSNYYLTLGRHGEWDAIRARVDEFRRFDASADAPPTHLSASIPATEGLPNCP